MSIFDQDLDKNAANFVPLSPVSFVERSAEVFDDLPAVIHGARRPNWAETPVAFVELRPGASADAAELIAHCKGLLAGYKLPREVRSEAIPKTSTGKIQKFALRERAAEPAPSAAFIKELKP